MESKIVNLKTTVVMNTLYNGRFILKSIRYLILMCKQSNNSIFLQTESITDKSSKSLIFNLTNEKLKLINLNIRIDDVNSTLTQN